MFLPAIIEEIVVYGASRPSHLVESGVVSPRLPTELVGCRTKRDPVALDEVVRKPQVDWDLARRTHVRGSSVLLFQGGPSF